jgi:hypothetical protein
VGIGRALYRGVKAAAKGGDAEKVVGEAVGGLVPLAFKGGADKVSRRVERGLRTVSDSGRSDTFTNHSTGSDSWGDSPTPSTPKDKSPEVDPWA